MNLYLVDDEFVRHMAFQALARRLEVDMPGCFVCPQLRDMETPVTKEAADVLARQSLSVEFLWSLYSSNVCQAVIVLDLVISDAIATETDQRQAVNQRIARLEQSDPAAGALLKNALTIVDTEPIFVRHFSAAFVATVAKLKGWKVLIASRNSSRPVVAPFRHKLNCISVPEEDLSRYIESLASALEGYQLDNEEKRELSEYLTECYIALLRMTPHSDPHISRFLMVYNEPFSTNNTLPWWHDACQDDNARTTASKLFSTPAGILPDANYVKALFMHNKDDAGFDYGRPRKKLASAQFVAVCGTLGLDATCASTAFRLPCNPGMAFLISLKELQNALNFQYALPTKALTFSSTKGADEQSKEYAVTIRLAPHGNSHPLNHFCEFMRQIGAGAESAHPPNGGVSLALWNACHARLGNLRDHASAQSFKLFRNGTEGFIAWPCFAENAITLRWCQHQQAEEKEQAEEKAP